MQESYVMCVNHCQRHQNRYVNDCWSSSRLRHESNIILEMQENIEGKKEEMCLDETDRF
jgi:hypothetical protein